MGSGARGPKSRTEGAESGPCQARGSILPWPCPLAPRDTVTAPAPTWGTQRWVRSHFFALGNILLSVRTRKSDSKHEWFQGPGWAGLTRREQLS